METVRIHSPGEYVEVQDLRHVVRGEVFEHWSDAVDRMDVQKSRHHYNECLSHTLDLWFHVKQCFQHLYRHLYPVSFGVEDDTFVIPVAGGPGLPHDLDSVIGHLLGQAVHLFF